MNKDILVLAKELKYLTQQSDNKKLRHFYNKNVYKSKFLFFNNVLTSEVLNESPYRNIAINFLKKSENYLPGGSILASRMFSDLIFNSNSEFLPTKKEKSIQSFKDIINQYIYEEDTKELILNTLKFAGPDGTVLCKPSKNNNITVVKKTNAKIPIGIDSRFEGIYFKSVKEVTKDFLVIALDAYLERESEIMTLLEHAKVNKMPVIVFCRGISDYFAKNIKEIIVRNSIYVYPYIVNFDNSDPFLFDDICSALELTKISAEAGHSFYKDLVDNSKNKKIKASASSIEFFERPAEAIESINKKLSESIDMDLRKYLIKRKNRLSPNTVEVSIPESKIRLIQDFKSLIRVYNISATSGIVEYKGTYYPTYSFNKIKNLTHSIYETMKSINLVVKLKK